MASTARSYWLVLIWALTFWIPSRLMVDVCGINEPELQILWREKVTSFALIMLLNVAMIFTVICLGNRALLTLSMGFLALNGAKTFTALVAYRPSPRPPKQDKFVICLVPAHVESEEVLRNCINSITRLDYNNKRRLLFIICDGIAVGHGNDRSTSEIVLEIMGVNPTTAPAELPFKSVGQGQQQLNFGQVYSGLYEFEGNVVPYVVIIKVGNLVERVRNPGTGNRGKVDSQVLLLRFLNSVHHHRPMSPLEFEILRQLINITGVHPELYEYLLMVDADMVVREDALLQLIAACTSNAKIAGICGETSLQNKMCSWWTMIQVYEYYTFFNLNMAFESAFGNITCLPGCFCLYRIRTVNKSQPLIISDEVIHEYSTIAADTLHSKLLRLGEDRYLTTLMMKHFPHMAFIFTTSAQAMTVGTETWANFRFQRCRWLNNTIHNLFETLFIRDLHGYFYSSVRILVLTDLFTRCARPAIALSFVYLAYKAVVYPDPPIIISLLIVGAVYALQAALFIITKRSQYIGWMAIHLVSFPIWNFILPIYAFWRQDSLDWGSTERRAQELGAYEAG